MREFHLLTPQWLQSDLRGRGSNSPLPDCNHGSPHSQTTGGGRNPKTWGTNLSQGLSMTEDVAIHIDQKLCRACTPRSQLEMALDRCTTDWAHPTVRTLSSYGSTLHPGLKAFPRKGLHRNCELLSFGHTGDTPCDKPPKKISYYHLRLIHFGH
jgi:hypothetical protein